MTAQVRKGEQATFTITPDTGYKTASVKLDGAVQTVTNGTITFTVTKDCTLTVEFTKSSDNNGNNGNSGNSGSSRPSRNDTEPSETLPAINGKDRSWADIKAELCKLTGGSAVINVNGNTTVPADVIKAIMDAKISVEFVIDSTKSWLVNGSNLANAASADLSSLPGKADKTGLRGVNGADLKVTGTSVPADLKLSFRKEYAGQFANVYKLEDNKLVFQSCIMVGEDGTVVISGAHTVGEYVVMACGYSDLLGDVNNDGVVNALDSSAILKDIVGIVKCANPQVGDFNCDGGMSSLDASAILGKMVLKRAASLDGHKQSAGMFARK